MMMLSCSMCQSDLCRARQPEEHSERGPDPLSELMGLCHERPEGTERALSVSVCISERCVLYELGPPFLRGLAHVHGMHFLVSQIARMRKRLALVSTPEKRIIYSSR